MQLGSDRNREKKNEFNKDSILWTGYGSWLPNGPSWQQAYLSWMEQDKVNIQRMNRTRVRINWMMLVIMRGAQPWSDWRGCDKRFWENGRWIVARESWHDLRIALWREGTASATPARTASWLWGEIGHMDAWDCSRADYEEKVGVDWWAWAEVGEPSGSWRVCLMINHWQLTNRSYVCVWWNREDWQRVRLSL